LQNQQLEYGPLVKAQNQSQLIHQQLLHLMTADMSWTKMLGTLRSVAPDGVRVTNVTGSLTAPGIPGITSSGLTPAQLGANALNQTGRLTIGELQVSGTAGTKNAVAAYADKLATVRGLTAPIVTDVTATSGAVTFTVNVLVTSDALGGRFSTASAAPTTGGK
jgi:Tfp pilus assembly protein PilN